MKGRTCADGRKKRQWKSKEEYASPTAHADSMPLTSIVDAHESRPVAAADVKGACLNAEFDEFLLIKFENEQVDIVCDIDGKHRKHVSTEGGKRVSCLAWNKALCRFMQSTLSWHNMISSYLIDMGFALSLCDSCVANKIVDRLQCTIAWHMDDNEMSHQKPEVVKAVTKELENKFGKCLLHHVGLNVIFWE